MFYLYRFLLTFLFVVSGLQAQTTIKLMSYNLMNYTSGGPSYSRTDDLRYILNQYQPDIFMVCELTDETSSDIIINTCLETQDYSAASFQENHSGSYRLQQMLYYNHHKFELTSETLIITLVRDINHYVLKLKSDQAQTDPVFIDVYVAHLKASQGANNENTRLVMAQDFTNDLQNIPQGHYVILAGDFNLYSSTEPAYQELLDVTNAIVLNDPVNRSGTWHNNYNFQDIHTQSTHTTSDSNFVGGGLDDRFDFILMSENMFTNDKLKYTPNSYKAFGNNGNCYNDAVNDTSCTGTYDMTLRNHLYNMSDHLPVVAELTSNQTLSNTSYAVQNKRFYIYEGTYISNEFHINSVDNQHSTISIYDLAGQLIFQDRHYNATKSIDVSNYKNGIYFIYIQQDNYKQIIKFVKTD